MKIIIFLSLFFMACNDKGAGDYSSKEYTVKITFSDGSSDTLSVNSVTEPFLLKGDFGANPGIGFMSTRSKIYASGVRSFKILNVNNIKP